MAADYCLYTTGLGAKGRATCALDAADLIITLGYDMVEYHPHLWNPNDDKEIIHADFEPTEINANYHPETEIVGDLAHTLWILNERVVAIGGLHFECFTHVALRREMQADFEEYKDDDTQGIIKPHKGAVGYAPNHGAP